MWIYKCVALKFNAVEEKQDRWSLPHHKAEKSETWETQSYNSYHNMHLWELWVYFIISIHLKQTWPGRIRDSHFTESNVCDYLISLYTRLHWFRNRDILSSCSFNIGIDMELRDMELQDMDLRDMDLRIN